MEGLRSCIDTYNRRGNQDQYNPQPTAKAKPSLQKKEVVEVDSSEEEEID